MNLEWADRAVCRERLEAGLPDLHGAPGENVHDARAARRVCIACPVFSECAAWAERFRWASVTVGGWTAPTSPSGAPHPGAEVALDRAYRDRRQERRALAKVSA